MYFKFSVNQVTPRSLHASIVHCLLQVVKYNHVYVMRRLITHCQIAEFGD